MPTDAPAPARDRLVLPPDDDANQRLIEAVHPPGWTNPRPEGRYNLVAIGAGTAGLVSAIATAGLGGRVALIERHLMGGDCLNVGCVPSKALLAAGQVAATARDAERFGVRTGAVEVDFGAVMQRLRDVRAQIAPHDSAARFREAGVDVFIGEARFTGPRTIVVGDQRLDFARALIATGARPALPPIEGLEAVDPATNETIFERTRAPRSLAVIGAGPIGCELAQAFRRCGVEVTLFDRLPRVLPNDDPDAADVVAERLAAEGVALRLGADIARCERDGEDKVVVYTHDGVEARCAVEEILVAAGRIPNVEGLGLEAAGVAATRRGVTVDDRLRTSNRRVYAAGDVCSRWQFTHAADAMARAVVQNAMFFGRKRHSALTVPWVTYTDPEVAHVGPLVSEISEGAVDHVITIPMAEVDRAICDGQTEGFGRFHVGRGGAIIAATIVAPNAGDMIAEVSLAMTSGLKMGAIASAIHPYPTQAEVIKRAADAYARTRLTPFVARLLAKILAWRR